MGARSEVQTIRHPWPAVYEALVRALPANGFELLRTDPAAGRIWAQTRRDRITVTTGAVDAITTEWVVDVESRLGLGRDRHAETVRIIAACLETHLATYYGG